MSANNQNNANAISNDCIEVENISVFLGAIQNTTKTTRDHIFFYRGHADKSFQLIPSIYRDEGWINNEDKIFKELILRCPNDFNGQKSTFQLLVKMQHYSLPTRLLDITTNPLIALYFACEKGEHFGKDAEVIIFKIPKDKIKYYDSDTVSVI